MTQTETPQAERLSELFDHFNETSARLSDSYRSLAEHVRRLTATAAGPQTAETTDSHESVPGAALLRGILNVLPAGVVLIDKDGVIRESNAEARKLLGVALSGRFWREIINETFIPGDGVDGLRLKNGRVVTVATGPLSVMPGQVVLLNDVTGTRVMQSLLERRQRLLAIGEMTASLSHQIRTPLASSLLYLSHLEREGLDPEARRRCAERIRACLGHLEHLSRDMLAFAGGGNLNAEDISIGELLAEFREVSAALLDQGACRLEVIDNSRGAGLRGNRAAILTVLQNLLENSLQACASAENNSGGSLRLLIRRIGDAGIESVELLFSDNGPGIPEKIRARVLEPFFSTRENGTGLGLAVARAVAQAHDGAIWIESQSGVGTTVGLRFPAAGSENQKHG